MSALPFVLDAKEAISFYHKASSLNDAQIAYLVGFLSNEGYSNKAIRESLGITKVYTVTHYKRAGTALSEAELILWSNNPDRITLGHVRAIAKMPEKEREKLLRGLLAKKKSVHEFELISQGKESSTDADIKRYSIRMGEVIGRPVEVSFHGSKKKGRLVLDFFSLDDLDDLAKALGYDPSDDY